MTDLRKRGRRLNTVDEIFSARYFIQITLRNTPKMDNYENIRINVQYTVESMNMCTNLSRGYSLWQFDRLDDYGNQIYPGFCRQFSEFHGPANVRRLQERCELSALSLNPNRR